MLFLIVPLSAVLANVGNEYNQGRHQAEAIRWAESQGAGVYYTSEAGEPQWQRKVLGSWFPSRVEAVDFSLSGSAPLVENLSPVVALFDLKWIDLSGTQVTDLSPLTRLPRLELLILENTAVTDLKPLARIANLRTLHLSIPPDADLEPLFELTHLERLKIRASSGPLSSDQMRTLRENLPQCRIESGA